MDDPAGHAAPPLPRFQPDEKVCGNCKLWQFHSTDARGWVGPCRLQPNRGLFPPSAPICDGFVPKGQVTVVAPPPSKGAPGRVLRSVAPVIVRKNRDPAEQVDFGGELTMTRDELMQIFREAAGEAEAPPLAAKWEGGMVQILPGKSDLQGKELPIDALFHKIVMIRDRLRTLEQKLNAHPKLTDAEKVEMQHYVTRVYGSLTSFNVLFKEKADQFVGAKSED